MKLGLENFRIFSDYQEFNFAPITVLTGPNNSGKSTLHRALYLMANSFTKKSNNLEIDYLQFEEISDKIGDFASNLSFNNDSPVLSFSIVYKSKITDGGINIKLSYKQNVNNKNGVLNKISFTMRDEKEKEILLFSLACDPRWEFEQFNFPLFKTLLLEIRDKGAEQELILDLSKKMRDTDYKLTLEEEQQVKDLREEGLILNADEQGLFDNNETVNINIPLQWCVYDVNTKSKYPYSKDYKKAYDLFSTPIVTSIIGSDFLTKIQELDYFNNPDKNNQDFYEINTMLTKENIFTEEDFSKKYSEFEMDVFYELLEYLNLSRPQSFVVDGEEIFPFEFLNGFIQNSIEKQGEQWEDLIHRLNNNQNESAFINHIWKNQNWGIRNTIENIRENNLADTKAEGAVNNSLNGSIYFLHLFWEEFTRNLKLFITNTKLLLFDTSIERHLLFDETSKFQLILTSYAKSRFAKRQNTIQEEFIKHWLKAFNLGSSIEIDKIMAGKELIGAEFYLKNRKGKVPLGDNGMGTNQLLLLILQIATASRGSRFLLEEPEASLHPAFQSKLADIFIDAHKKFVHTFLVESHSEYLIRKLQFQTAKKIIKPEDTQIYYFHHPDMVPDGEKQIKRLSIRDDGMMDDDFGEGFFDESTRLTIDLLKLQNQN